MNLYVLSRVGSRTAVGVPKTTGSCVICASGLQVSLRQRQMRFEARELAAVFAGGFIGTVARAELAVEVHGGAGGWPWPTFLVNVAGAFMLG